ncbi:DNA cytosine methyltransferase [Paraburkholderia antibiotica]|uniref:Cytosine-specific methyltransferase n=1 Tax=Paraburkholderia antibiotica TaxID=2728839 RepID=A0A7X9ZYY0_9BURK|nr:DNA cytosine methyltransferase [Paraburkholderia antibiotica]NML31808.1 DNA cytosine methyltransferase [Paraburkholderia antibiotica]
MSIRFGSVCSGIEAASVAWHSLGWRTAFLSEIEPFPCAVLAHHYPTVPNLGDMTKFRSWPDATIDLLVGGTPCQSYSIAGLRKGLADPRGNLMLTYLAIAARYRPSWLVWENVPGVLSVDGGRAFGTLLGGLAELGYGFAYRVLDAQYVRVESHARAVPQRRRRVFVVGYLGDWRPPAAVLFERESLRGHPPPCRKAAQDVAGALTRCAFSGGAGGRPEGAAVNHFVPVVPVVARALTASNQRIDAESETLLVAHALRGEGFDASEDGTGRGTPIIPIAFDCKASGSNGFGVGEIASTLRSMGHAHSQQSGGGHLAVLQPYTLAVRGRAGGHELEYRQDGTANAVLTPSGGRAGIGVGAVALCDVAVRRLTPLECERLQGFPDGYTAIPFNGKRAADGLRYKALGNSMAIPPMRWIGERIQLVDAMHVAQQYGVTA